MREGPKQKRPVRILADGVARKIAAGEIIDRPFSVVRELLDNSLDAGADEIVLEIRGGGTESIRVKDNGAGMSREDLELCFLPHATSKIESIDDLIHCGSLGFRGEALAGISAVSRLIISSSSAGGTPNVLKVEGGKLISLGPGAAPQGTAVEAADLFYNLPARKRFIKSSAAESGMCRTALIEKALPFPGVSFRFFSEGNMKTYLPASNLIERVKTAYPGTGGELPLRELSGTGDGFTVTAAAALPEYSRRDRKYLQLFINTRRIWDYSLIQGIEYAFSEVLPGGRFPGVFVFITIDPGMVDFNIHPAKKEARIRGSKEIRRVLVDILRTFVTTGTKKSLMNRNLPDKPAGETGFDFGPVRERPGLPSSSSGHDPASQAFRKKTSSEYFDLSRRFEPPGRTYSFTYLGPVFGMFLAVEKGDEFYLIDQHAAHERVIYNRLLDSESSQKLLIPVIIELPEEESGTLSDQLGDLEKLGIGIRREGESWELFRVPARGEGLEEAVADVIRETAAGKSEAGEELRNRITAGIACRAAVKDGDPVDQETACSIIEAAFALEAPRCPHGRPVWYRISREELFRFVGRLV
ncbi:MAG: DNA mismatch repair endonuclease MutL [Spirochaetia bacterium]